MGIGNRHRIELVQHVTGRRTNGTNSNAAGDKFKTWAEITTINNDRDSENGQVLFGQLKRFASVRFRFDKYPGAKWSINYNQREWTVTSVVQEKEKKFYWTITAQCKADVQG